MNKDCQNHFTGRRSAGFRFRLNCRPISHAPLYLPLAMKSLPEIIDLSNGVSPLEVFNSDNIRDARKAFNRLREKFDFTFWAARNFFVRDINDSDCIVPMLLSPLLTAVIDIFERRYFNRKLGRYIITKPYGRIGLTTTMQAYILWRQLFSDCGGYANICGATNFNTLHLKANLSRFLGWKNVPDRMRYLIKLPWTCAIFSSIANPDATRGMDISYGLFADMSQWRDPTPMASERAIGTVLGSILLEYRTLTIMEGNRPKNFPDNEIDLYRYYQDKIKCAQTRPPLLLREAVYASLHSDNAPYVHIKL